MEDGFPELTDSFLAGQDVLYKQFNDIEFYVEDTEQEHFYFNILKKIFPEITFEKIFPLNGKKNVIEASKLTILEKDKIYLVDLDFDQILGIKETIENLFYLERYSIENHLFSKNAIFEIIREKNAKLKNEDIEAIFNYEEILLESKDLLEKLSSCFVINQKYSLGITHFGLNPNRDFDLAINTPTFKNNFITDFFEKTENAVINFNNTLTLETEILKVQEHFDSLENAIINIPGKYFLNLIKCKLERLRIIYQVSIESFTYKLSKEFHVGELEYLKIAVNEFIN